MSDHTDGVSVQMAAEALGVSQKTIYRRIKAGELRAHKLHTSQGYEWRVHLGPQPADVQPVVHADGQDGVSVQLVERLDTPPEAALRLVLGEVAALRQEVAELRLRALAAPHGPPVPVALAREEIPSEITARPADASGFLARVRRALGL